MLSLKKSIVTAVLAGASLLNFAYAEELEHSIEATHAEDTDNHETHPSALSESFEEHDRKLMMRGANMARKGSRSKSAKTGDRESQSTREKRAAAKAAKSASKGDKGSKHSTSKASKNAKMGSAALSKAMPSSRGLEESDSLMYETKGTTDHDIDTHPPALSDESEGNDRKLMMRGANMARKGSRSKSAKTGGREPQSTKTREKRAASKAAKISSKSDKGSKHSTSKASKNAKMGSEALSKAMPSSRGLEESDAQMHTAENAEAPFHKEV